MAKISSKDQQSEIDMRGRRYLFFPYIQDFSAFMHSSQVMAKQLGVIFRVRPASQFQSFKPRNAILDAIRSSICPQNQLLLVVDGGLTLKLMERLFFQSPELDVRSYPLSMSVISRRHKLPKVRSISNPEGCNYSGCSHSVAFNKKEPPSLITGGERRHNSTMLSPDGSKAVTLEGHSDVVINSLAFHQSAPLVATSNFDNTVKVWRIPLDDSPATCATTLGGHNGGVAFHPEDLLLAIGGDKTASVWELSPDGSVKTCVATLGDGSYVNFIEFHPSAPIMATSSNDVTIKLWRLLYSSNKWSVNYMATLKGHDAIVNCIAFHPTAPIMASGSSDYTAKVWRMPSKNSPATCVETLTGHSNIIVSVAFHPHPTASILATSEGGNITKVWKLHDRSAAICMASLETSTSYNSNKLTWWQ